MSRSFFRIRADLLDSYEFACLSDADKWRDLRAAFSGKPAISGRYIEARSERPWGGKAWQRLRAAVFARDGHRCRYCGAADVPLEADHVIPASRGGRNDEGNLVASCKPCNASKGDRLIGRWRPKAV